MSACHKLPDNFCLHPFFPDLDSIGIGVLNNWTSANFFQPMIATSSQTFTPIISFFLFLALLILGITYLLAVFVRLDVVSPRSMAVWYLAGLLFFQLGPSFYASMNDLRNSQQLFLCLVTQRRPGPIPVCAARERRQQSQQRHLWHVAAVQQLPGLHLKSTRHVQRVGYWPGLCQSGWARRADQWRALPGRRGCHRPAALLV